MWFEVLTLIFGIVLGFLHKGKEDYAGILKNGVIIGIVLSTLFVLLSAVLPGGTSFNVGFLGVLGIFIEIVIFVIIFIAGSFIGDQLSGVLKK
jgi:hypothetical protein